MRRGTQISTTVHEQLDKILSQSRRFKEALAQVAQSSAQQNEGIGQVTQAIEQIDRVTQQNATSSEETSGAAQEMKNQSRAILEQIESLERIVSGNRGVAPPVSRQAPNSQKRSQTLSVRPSSKGGRLATEPPPLKRQTEPSDIELWSN